jgi:hypothetical protein
MSALAACVTKVLPKADQRPYRIPLPCQEKLNKPDQGAGKNRRERRRIKDTEPTSK